MIRYHLASIQSPMVFFIKSVNYLEMYSHETNLVKSVQYIEIDLIDKVNVVSVLFSLFPKKKIIFIITNTSPVSISMLVLTSGYT